MPHRPGDTTFRMPPARSFTRLWSTTPGELSPMAPTRTPEPESGRIPGGSVEMYPMSCGQCGLSARNSILPTWEKTTQEPKLTIRQMERSAGAAFTCSAPASASTPGRSDYLPLRGHVAESIAAWRLKLKRTDLKERGGFGRPNTMEGCHGKP